MGAYYSREQCISNEFRRLKFDSCRQTFACENIYVFWAETLKRDLQRLTATDLEGPMNIYQGLGWKERRYP